MTGGVGGQLMKSKYYIDWYYSSYKTRDRYEMQEDFMEFYCTYKIDYTTANLYGIVKTLKLKLLKKELGSSRTGWLLAKGWCKNEE